MITVINKNIKIWQEFNPAMSAYDENQFDSFAAKNNLDKLLFNRQRIAIKNRWFDVLTPSEIVRSQNESDGYYRVIYIQIRYGKWRILYRQSKSPYLVSVKAISGVWPEICK